ncbi:cupin domain-containing protein [Planctomicrobium sp. SH527]|uniref:cupin domain-containing protein n=1 Tax=Planctomicrobium sp. SH527 TaxID=3448123 RepID=UPI003F5AFA18
METRSESPVNLFEGVPTSLTVEQVDQLLQSGRTRIERIVSTGQASPDGFWYDQEEEEWVMVLKGSAKIQFQKDQRVVTMHEGDSIFIPAHCLHRVDWTSPDEPTIWLAIFFQK